jgi:hypothetical protein
MPAPVVWVVGNPMKIRPPFLLGRTEAKTSVAADNAPDPCEISDACASSYEDVRMDSFVTFGGGFLVALSNSDAKFPVTNVLMAAVVTLRKILDFDSAVISSEIEACAVFSSLAALVVFEDVAVSLEKKLRSDGISAFPRPYASFFAMAA